MPCVGQVVADVAARQSERAFEETPDPTASGGATGAGSRRTTAPLVPVDHARRDSHATVDEIVNTAASAITGERVVGSDRGILAALGQVVRDRMPVT